MNAANRRYCLVRPASFDKPQFGVIVALRAQLMNSRQGRAAERTGLKRTNKKFTG
jgi:hypothetical protein